jgi:hypothetical protein
LALASPRTTLGLSPYHPWNKEHNKVLGITVSPSYPRSGIGLHVESGFRFLMIKNGAKIVGAKNFIFKLKNCNKFYLVPFASLLQKKPANLQRDPPTKQNMTFFHFILL